jgi:plasmid stabilization system protein ParE
MAYEIQLLDRAVEDIDAISGYLAQSYPGTAGRFLDGLERSLDGLAQNPYMYAEYEHNRAYRRMLVQDYLVFYKIFKARKIVHIYRILHGKRNIEAFLH